MWRARAGGCWSPGMFPERVCYVARAGGRLLVPGDVSGRVCYVARAGGRWRGGAPSDSPVTGLSRGGRIRWRECAVSGTARRFGGGGSDTGGSGRQKSCKTRQCQANGRGLSCYPGSSCAARQGSALKPVLTRCAGFRACDRGDCGGSGQRRHLGAADRCRRRPRRDRVSPASRRNSPPLSRYLSGRACASDPCGESAGGGPRVWRERGAQPSLGSRALGAARGVAGRGRCHGDRQESRSPAGHKASPRSRAAVVRDQVHTERSGDESRQDDLRHRRR